MTADENSVLAALWANVQAHPDHTAFRFVRRRGELGDTLSVGELWKNAEAVAHALPDMADAKHTGVMLFCGDAQTFVTAMIAAWMRGATVIPAAGGMNAGLAERNKQIIDAGKPDIILHDLTEARAADLKRLAPEAEILDVNLIGKATRPRSNRDETFDLSGGQLLQFTSGSTNAAKAVLLTPEDIALNAKHIRDTYGLDPNGTCVHWLPLYHDMGLVGSVLAPLYAGQPSVLIRPSVFIQNPLEWLDHLTQWRATITSSPNFAYDMLVNRLDKTPEGKWDLSSLQTFICGGEPVREDTIGRVVDRLGRYGLSKAAIAPSYGMAEAVLMISSGQRQDGPKFLRRQNEQSLACLGKPGGGVEVDIVEPISRAGVEHGTFGEVWIKGCGCGRVIPQGQSWRVPYDKKAIRTGDWGMIVDGDIYIAGRDADRIILRGRNVLAEDIEAIVYASQPEAGAADGVVAFGIPQNGTEVLHVLVERGRDGPAFNERAFFSLLGARLDIRCEGVTVVRRGSLPRTTSGKVRRAASRDAFLELWQDQKGIER
ncbi:AMP-binding protein [uncultured Tateyamaria sp.]|uniref:AMP-binding protein n=1 Tax=uncultured Tateyamaria sp. TaxID=455651 RepID=UPI002603BBF3|nr:AMP-binding protein [uncultured Tateyamaria sp.]